MPITPVEVVLFLINELWVKYNKINKIYELIIGGEIR